MGKIFAHVILVLAILLWPRFGSANYLQDPLIVLDPSAPALPDQANDSDKLGFAAASLAWARAEHPVTTFQPTADGKLDPVEWQLVEALEALRTVPDSPSDKLAKAQEEQRDYAAWDAVKKGILSWDPKAAVKDIYNKSITSTVAGDGQGPTRDALRAWIVSVLYDYQTKSGQSDPSASLTKLLRVDPPRAGGDGPTLEARPGSSNPVDLSDAFHSAEQIRQKIKKNVQETDAARAANSKRDIAHPVNPVPPPLSPSYNGPVKSPALGICLTCPGGDGFSGYIYSEP